MAKSENQKRKLLYLADLLRRETDETHGLTVQQMIDELARRDVRAERKSIYDDLQTLTDYGMDIVKLRSGHTCSYALVHRDFELPELKLLVDAVQSSKFLSARKSRELIRKLEGLASWHEAQSLQRQVYVAGRVKSMNESIYYTIDQLHAAISADRQVSFLYGQWTVDKTVCYRRNGQRYRVSPYALVWDSENYYLVAYEEEAGAIRHYRADKMASLRMEEDKPRQGRQAFEALDMAAYTRRTFGMFGGETRQVTLWFARHLAGAVIDRFGRDVTLVPDGEDGFRLHIQAVISPPFMGWLAGFGPDAKLLEPGDVRLQFARFLQKTLEQYEKND